MAAGKHDEATHVLQEAVNRGDTTWRVYSLLAQQHVRAGDYGGAQKIFLSYPYFNKIPDDRQVDVSNYAKDAAQTLYEAGSYEEAKPLYRIAAGLKTGAGSQLSAAQHLAQLDGDIRTAAALAYQRSVRYRSGKAYGDYLVYLHLLGFHDEADAGFKAVASQFDSASLWNAPFVGQRMRGLSLSDIAKWSDAYVRSDGKAEERQIDLQSLATRYVFAQALVDRKPAGKALELVAGVAGNGTKRALTRKHELQDVFAHVSATIDCTRNIAACGGDPKNGYRYSLDRYAGFLDAYVLLERERYEESLAAFAAFDASYAMFRMETGRYALPYVALAAVKAGHKDENAVFVNMLTTCCTDDPYYALLAESVIDGAQHRTNDAYEKLVAAFHEGSTDDAPIGAWYEITDISERLYGMTHDKRFLATALAWAKKHQVIRPQAGWAYAFEARYGTTEADRIRGAAFAQYLDPQSRWLAQVPASIRERGKRWWARNNPYTAAGSKSASAI